MKESWCIKHEGNWDIIRRYSGFNMYSGGSENIGSYYGYDHHMGHYFCRKDPLGEELSLNEFREHILKDEPTGYILRDGISIDSIGKIVRGAVDFSDMAKHPKEYSRLIDRMKKAKVFDVWFEPVFDTALTMPKICGYEGRIHVQYVKYGCKSLAISTVRDLIKLGITELTIDDDFVVNVDEMKAILEYYESL